MKIKLLENLSGQAHRIGFKTRQASPEILIILGIGGVITATVMACKATLKVDEVLEEYENKVAEINDTLEDPKYAERYSKEDSEMDIKTVKIKTAVKLVKLYAPAVIIGTMAIGCIVGSHYILQKRNAGLAAAYAAMDTAYKEYRKRVAEKYGEAAERDIRRGTKTDTIVEKIRDENGNEKEVERTVTTHNSANPYSRLFGEGNRGWERNASLNWFTLRNIQSICNRKLHSRGYLYLNEVYDMLGMECSEAGQVCGWIAEPKNTDWPNYVDFGLGEQPDEDEEPNMWIELNVAGIIVDQVHRRKY